MEKEDKLIIQQLNMQCIVMKQSLKNANEKLMVCKERLNEVIANEALAGEAYSALRSQLNDYIFSINIMHLANEIFIGNCDTLRFKIGTEDLVGEVIFENIQMCQNMIREAKWDLARENSYKDVANWLDAEDFHESRIREAQDKIDRYTELLHVWEAKCQRYDDIAGDTAELFTEVQNLFAAITKGNEQVAVRFSEAGNKYDLSSVSVGWRISIMDALHAVQLTKRSCLKNENFIEVYDEATGQTYFGGDQGWFMPKVDGSLSGRDAMKGYGIASNGCTMIALINASLYMDGITRISKEEYMQYANEIFNSNPIFKELFVWNSTGNFAYIEGSLTDEQSLYEEIVKKHGYKGVTWNYGKDVAIEDIKDQLEHDIPVIFEIAGSEDDTDENELVFYSKGGDGEFYKTYSVKFHEVVVTGVEDYYNIEEGKVQRMLNVSSWGEHYYINYDEVVEKKKEYDKTHGFGVDYNGSHVIYK